MVEIDIYTLEEKVDLIIETAKEMIRGRFMGIRFIRRGAVVEVFNSESGSGKTGFQIETRSGKTRRSLYCSVKDDTKVCLAEVISVDGRRKSPMFFIGEAAANRLLQILIEASVSV
jgi:hypothetical protein